MQLITTTKKADSKPFCYYPEHSRSELSNIFDEDKKLITSEMNTPTNEYLSEAEN